MASTWERGQPISAEEILKRHPELVSEPSAATRLIYEEICLREARGEAWEPADLLGRFPQWSSELEILFDCHQLVRPRPVARRFPEVGETLGDCRLVAELGRGALGRVFLALQTTLGDRPVVLKVTRRSGGEHLSMARLQHPNIMPLYAVHDFAGLDLRALCMPYLGGVALSRFFETVGPRPPGQLTGEVLLQVLDRARTDQVALPPWSSTRQFLAGATYPHAICWIGACLADALHYAHERGLLHLDLKPSNVLLADDGQPMLLDFHLSQGPLRQGAPAPDRLGGTRGYMSPEHESAISATRRGHALASPLDRRSDIYSLGVILYEALVGRPPDGAASASTSLCPGSHPHVTPGLTDILAKALAPEPAARYADAAALADDLRRHLEHRPLIGVANRSLKERCLKWWHRHRFVRS
jgi:serine/threonine protein kinase